MPTEPAPIIVDPSGDFLGNDGSWSTFSITVGSPPQKLQVLASTEQSSTWAVAPAGCGSGDASNCSDARGGLFDPSKSTSWFRKDVYRLNEASNLGYGGIENNGTYGFDTLALAGAPGVADATLEQQVVASIATDSFYLGSLGLTPTTINFTTSGDSSPSLLSSLKTKGMIPSLSFGYTAGASYRDKGWNASLVLGGYDTSRYTPNNLQFNLTQTPMRQLVVGVQAITYSDSKGETALLSQGILSLVDSTVPYLWLPQSSCQAFENAFGISWDPIKNLYLINETTHDTLLKVNPSVTFSLADSNSPTSVNITFPYAAFDLNATSPLVKTESRYFPLQRAADDNSYTLGRTFFQEAYMITNFEDSTFSISQATFDATAPSHIVPIAASTTSTPPNPSGTSIIKSTGNGSKGIGTGAIAGVAIAIALVGIIVAIVAFFFMRHRRRVRRESEQAVHGAITYESTKEDDTPQRDSSDEHSDPKKQTTVAAGPASGPMTPPLSEVEGHDMLTSGSHFSPTELPGSRLSALSRSELSTPEPWARTPELPSDIQAIRSELSTPEPVFPDAELPTPDPAHELPSPSLSTTMPSHPSPSLPSASSSPAQRPLSMRMDSTDSESGFTRDGMRQFHRRYHSDESRPLPTRKASDDSSIESPVLGYLSSSGSDVETPDFTTPVEASRPPFRRTSAPRPRNQRLGSADSETWETRLESASETGDGSVPGSRFGTLNGRGGSTAVAIPRKPIAGKESEVDKEPKREE